MKIQVLFNSTTEQQGLRTGWGISCLVDGHILFDTGESGSALLKNLDTIGIRREAIDTVVISHDHWDHTGGLWDLLEARPGGTLHVCPGFTSEFFRRVESLDVTVFKHDALSPIAPGVFVTGQIMGQYKGADLPEQALVFDREQGISVLCGCAHPGVIQIMEKVKADFPGRPVDAVLGGFHLLKVDPVEIAGVVSRLRAMGVRRVGPTHCSGPEAERMFHEAFGDAVVSMNVGEGVEV